LPCLLRPRYIWRKYIVSPLGDFAACLRAHASGVQPSSGRGSVSLPRSQRQRPQAKPKSHACLKRSKPTRIPIQSVSSFKRNHW
jgi:hypothetical protein